MIELIERDQFVDLCGSIFITRPGEFADSEAAFDVVHWLPCCSVLPRLKSFNSSLMLLGKSALPNVSGFESTDKRNRGISFVRRKGLGWF